MSPIRETPTNNTWGNNDQNWKVTPLALMSLSIANLVPVTTIRIGRGIIKLVLAKFLIDGNNDQNWKFRLLMYS